MLIARAASLTAGPAFLIGFAFQGFMTGLFWFVSGGLATTTGLILVGDVGGAGSTFAGIYLRAVRGHKASPDGGMSEADVWIWRLFGLPLVLGGLTLCAIGVATALGMMRL